jgi:hypothetical protein
VPARYGMVAAVFFSMLAGAGAALVMRAMRGVLIPLVALSALFIAEAAFAPMLVNSSWGGNYVVPPSRIETAANAPAVYHTIARMPDARVITEFPFGDISWELRFVYYSSAHWKRLVNGYSGTFPANYKTRVALFEHVSLHPDEAWQALRATGTTHVIVHEGALSASEATLVKTWLTDHFAVEIARFEQDVLFDVDGIFER